VTGLSGNSALAENEAHAIANAAMNWLSWMVVFMMSPRLW
jgi:hypothetical protein